MDFLYEINCFELIFSLFNPELIFIPKTILFDPNADKLNLNKKKKNEFKFHSLLKIDIPIT